ncbi:RNase H and integrase-like protein, partial [Operophtera brumata]
MQALDKSLQFIVVNSRPLTHVAVTPEAPEALTPNHLLLGANSHVPAPGAFAEDDEHARQHWRRAQYLADEFWRRWLHEYLPLLQQRREPHTTGEPPRIGDLVLICDNNLPRNTWPRGKVSALHPGADG